MPAEGAPTVENAIALLQDPAAITREGRDEEFSARGVVQVSGAKVMNDLMELGLGTIDEDECRDLILEALQRLGGTDTSYWFEPPSLGGGRWGRRKQRVFVVEIPARS